MRIMVKKRTNQERMHNAEVTTWALNKVNVFVFDKGTPIIHDYGLVICYQKTDVKARREYSSKIRKTYSV